MILWCRCPDKQHSFFDFNSGRDIDFLALAGQRARFVFVLLSGWFQDPFPIAVPRLRIADLGRFHDSGPVLIQVSGMLSAGTKASLPWIGSEVSDGKNAGLRLQWIPPKDRQQVDRGTVDDLLLKDIIKSRSIQPHSFTIVSGMFSNSPS